VTETIRVDALGDWGKSRSAENKNLPIPKECSGRLPGLPVPLCASGDLCSDPVPLALRTNGATCPEGPIRIAHSYRIRTNQRQRGASTAETIERPHSACGIAKGGDAELTYLDLFRFAISSTAMPMPSRPLSK